MRRQRGNCGQKGGGWTCRWFLLQHFSTCCLFLRAGDILKQEEKIIPCKASLKWDIISKLTLGLITLVVLFWGWNLCGLLLLPWTKVTRTQLHTPRKGNNLGELRDRCLVRVWIAHREMLLSPMQPHCAAAVLLQKACTIQAAVPGSLETAGQVSPNIWEEWQNPFNTSLSQRGEAAPSSCTFLSCRAYSLGRLLFYWENWTTHWGLSGRQGLCMACSGGTRPGHGREGTGPAVLAGLREWGCSALPAPLHLPGSHKLRAMETVVPPAAGACRLWGLLPLSQWLAPKLLILPEGRRAGDFTSWEGWAFSSHTTEGGGHKSL